MTFLDMSLSLFWEWRDFHYGFGKGLRANILWVAGEVFLRRITISERAVGGGWDVNCAFGRFVNFCN